MKDATKGKIFGTVTVGERGQVVVPADIRKTFNINPGDKLIVMAKTGMISLVPVEEFNRFLAQATQAMEKIKK